NREITQEELAQSNGSEGRPAFVAVNGTVYDMTQIIQWAGGTHFGQYAGKDLSNEFAICHKGAVDILNKLPKVGILKQ
ncbi:MAG TPA: cytochrome b5 domain-containing protein, partial [Bacteroidales bacterium]|nr:cytochrome b5 domain-containing protein [Bacteroidales bacterium]